MDIKEKIKDLPASPGVYLMKDEAGAVLYVGKALNLRKRASSYFYQNRRLAGRIEALVEKIRDIAYIPTATEAEALIYENGLIKQLSPRYNVALKDGKSYPMLKLTVNEKFPRLLITRQRKDDGALYYGPYTDATLLREAVSILRRLFPLRTCRAMPKRVCLNYHLKQCPGPCAGKVEEADYKDVVRELELFLDGKSSELVAFISAKMAKASGSQDFEKAARLRDRIEALSTFRENGVSYTTRDELDELGRVIGMDKRIEVIEAFDVSNTMGREAVGSMISFYKGRPRKSEYRHFRIKTVSGVDDYSMMRELVRRRYRRMLEEKRSLPDLVVIDGGKGHLGVATDELGRMGLGGLAVIGIAKEFERIYTPDKKDPIVLPKESKAMHLVQRIRDEAHRFAIAYHKKLLSKKVESSELDRIKGVGPKRRRSLLNRFGSVDKIREAGLDELKAEGGIDEKTARNIVGYFKR